MGQFLIMSFDLPPIAVVLLFNVALVRLRRIKHSVYCLGISHTLKALYQVSESQRMPFRKCKDPFHLLWRKGHWEVHSFYNPKHCFPRQGLHLNTTLRLTNIALHTIGEFCQLVSLTSQHDVHSLRHLVG